MPSRDAILALIGAGAGNLGRSLQAKRSELRADERDANRAKLAMDQLLARKIDPTSTIERTIIDPKDGSVWNVFGDGSVARAQVRPGSETPRVPDAQGASEEDRPEAPGLRLGVKPPAASSPKPKTQLVRSATNEMVPVDTETGLGPDGKPVRAYQAPTKEPANTGAATIKTKVAANRTQASVIDDALRELDAHPDAVGLTRGLPFIGDRLDPRADPEGVGARAQIANVGSLKIHDRSGAAVSVHEFPRLAPFVPLLSDPPAAIRTKLAKLKAALEEETNLLEQSDGGTPAPVAKPSFAERVRQLKAEGKSKEEAKAILQREGYQF